MLSATIHDLPNETLQEVLKYVGFLGAFRHVSLVCRSWKAIASDPYLYSELNFSCGDLGRQLSDVVFKRAIALCPKIKVLNMSRTHITNAGLEIIGRSCPDLQSLDLSYCVRLKTAKYDCLLKLPHLKHLNLLGTWKVGDPHLLPLVPFFHKGIRLSMTIEIMGVVTNFSPSDEEILFNQMLKLDAIDLHLGHELARSFLASPTLPLFSSSLVGLEIGSRFTTAAISDIPPQIGCLTSLSSLSIVSHTLRSLPSELVNLTSLKSLLISSSRGYNTFPTIPPQITQLVNLESLNLCWNRLTHVPASIVNMTSLKRLNLSNNLLDQLPTQFGDMIQLKRLNLSENKLRTIPESLGNLVHLCRLNVANNSLTHIPEKVFKNMRNLYSIDIQNNKLTDLPGTIAQPNLRELIANNNLLESIPSNIGIELSLLKKLILHENRLSSLPAQLEGLTSLKHLALSGNLLEHLPAAVGTLRNLRVLQLSHNRLQELPSTVTSMRKLRKVELQNNQFSSLVSLRGIQGVDSLKSVHFDDYLQEDHSELCMCKFCVFSRFDEAHFEEIVEGDSEFEEELINLFFNCTETDFAGMSKALIDNSFDDIFFISHKIKGALSNMGAVKLSHVCSLLESQARLRDLSSCTDLFEKLKLEYKHIKRVLVKRLQRSGKLYPAFSFALQSIQSK